ncbi:glycoside hydrolase family 127 protein [Paraburkholderia hospita]
MLGLLRWYERTSDINALTACRRAADLMCARYLGRAFAIASDHPGDDEKNQAVAHVLALLYEYTGEPAYLALVREIEVEWTHPPCGNYVDNALQGRDFFAGTRPRWESLHDVQAIAELYFITGDVRYRVAFEQIWSNIRNRDRHVTGGFTSGEAATGDSFDPRYIETCGTVAWMAITIDMLRITADSIVADELELSLFNAILGAQSPDGRLWTYHTPMGGIPVAPFTPAALLGYRLPAYYDLAWQSRDRYPQLSCCAANGPRGIGCMSEWAVMGVSDAIVVNYYGTFTATVRAVVDTEVTLTQTTDYPFDGAVKIVVSVSNPAIFTIRLRIPTWSTATEIDVNGARQFCEPGTYCDLDREWSSGDVIALTFDMSIRLVAGQNNAFGLSVAFRGPLLLAFDRRFGDFDPLSPPTLTATPPPKIAIVENRALLATFSSSEGEITLCDFAGAGQSFSGNLTDRPEMSGVWQFSRSDGTIIAEQIRFAGDGTIDGHSHPNEARWGFDGDTFTFFTATGVPSTRFIVRTVQYGHSVLSGMSLIDASVRHVISQVDLDIVSKTWQFRRLQEGAETILWPTMRLLADGTFDIPTNPNETSWGMEGETLVFYAADGAASTRFTSIQMRNGRVQRRGRFVFDNSIVHELAEVDLDVTSMVWRFSRKLAGGIVGPPLADKLRLLEDHRLDGYWHPNEARWGRGDSANKLVFFSSSGGVSTYFDNFDAKDGIMRFEGTFAFDKTISHVLEESTPGWKVDEVYVSWLPLTAMVSQGNSILTRASNHMDLFWVHSNGSVFSTWWDATIDGGRWDPARVFVVTQPAEAIAAPIAAVARAPNHMDLFWVHSDGSIRSTWWNSNVENGFWDPARVFAVTAPGEAVGGPLGVVARAPDHMDVFWVHSNGSIHSTWWDANVETGVWDPARVFAVTAPGEAVGGPLGVVARAPDHMDVFWVHSDGSIHSTWWDANVENGVWDPARVFAVTAPGEAVSGPVTVIARAPDHMDVFWVHSDGSIRSTWWDANVENGMWDPARVFAVTAPGEAVSGPAAIARAPDHMDVFWIHSDGSIRSTWWDANVENGMWDLARVFAATGRGQAASGTVGAVARAPDHMDVFWLHSDGSIHSTWWDSSIANGIWDPARVFAVTAPGNAAVL